MTPTPKRRKKRLPKWTGWPELWMRDDEIEIVWADKSCYWCDVYMRWEWRKPFDHLPWRSNYYQDRWQRIAVIK